MLYIKNFDLNERTVHLLGASHNLRLVGHMYMQKQGLELVDETLPGWALLPPLHPTLSPRFRGISVDPPSDVGLFVVRDTYWAFSEGVWSMAPDKTLFTLQEFAVAIAYWSGPIQIGIELLPKSNSSIPINIPPRVESIQIGVEFHQDLLQYIIEFPLKEFLRKSITFSLLVEVVEGVVGADQLPGFSISEIESVELHWAVEDRVIAASIINGEIVADELFSGYAYTVITHSVEVYKRRKRDTTQIESVPSLALSLETMSRQHEVWAKNSLCLGGDEQELTVTPTVFDAVIEILVLDYDENRCWTIAKQLFTKIQSQGFLEVPAVDDVVTLQVSNVPQLLPSAPAELEQGDAYAISFQIRIPHLVCGSFSKREPTVTWGPAQAILPSNP